MGTNGAASSDFVAFVQRATQARKAEPLQVARAGRNLIDGALRIRRGGDGLYAEVERPITKPAEAVGAWMGSLERQLDSGQPFGRAAEMREALVAAAEEVDAAAAATPAAERLRSALFSDALETIGGTGGPAAHQSFLGWIVAAALGGILIGVLLSRKR